MGTRLLWPGNESMAVSAALKNDVNVDHAKRMLELTRLLWPGNESMAVYEALKNEHKDVNVDHAKRMLELTRLGWPDNERYAVLEVLQVYHKDVDVDQAHRMLRLTKILYPDHIIDSLAALQALKLSKYKAVDVDKIYEIYQDLKNSNSWYDYLLSTSDSSYMTRAFRLTYPEIVKEDF